MNTLSLAMIVRDEEKTLGRLFDSVRGCFDEVVVVDTGSKDRTRDIALQYGTKVYDFEWVDDFAAARNFSFSKVTSPWVCWLDADDVLLPADRDRLIALKSTLGNADVYLMPYDYAQDEYGKSRCIVQQYRILRMSMKPKWNLPVHEYLELHGGWRQANTDVMVTHKRDLEGMTRDKGRNLRILEGSISKNPTNKRLKFYYGKELHYEGQYEKSIQVLESYVKSGDWIENVVNAWVMVATSYYHLSRYEEAIDAALKGIRLDPRWAEFYCLIGQVYYDRKDWRQAIRWFEIAAERPVPESMAPGILIENYTWIPRDRLCKAFAEIGEWKKSNEWNEKALSNRPDDKRLNFNREFLRDQLFDRLSARPVRLNLGSGGKPCSGYRPCDLFSGSGIEFQVDQAKLPYRDGTVHAIRSEHALEHSASHYTAESTIKEWARASRYGATLHLMVPDLDLCCQAFIHHPDRARETNERWTQKEWFKYTIYGIQVGQNHEPDQGQYHRTGFTKNQLCRLLIESGYEVKGIGNYDGFSTPSIEVHAIQVRKKPKVGWLLRGLDPNDPSTRIRRLNPHTWLSANGIDSVLIPNYQTRDEGAIFAMTRDYDVVVFSFFSDLERKAMDRLRQAGITVIADYNEDLDEYPEVGRCLASASVIVCCSKALAEKASRFGRTTVISDAYEMLK